jgi:predicted permease
MLRAQLRSLWRAVFRRSQVEQEMARELQFHLDARAADLVSRDGVTPIEALRRARIEFGSVEKYKEQGRSSLGVRLIDEFHADLRFAVRTFSKSKGFVAAVTAILALGIGANTAVFSVVDAMLLGELPVRNPEELVAFDTLHGRGTMLASYSGNGRPGPGGTSRRTSFSALTFERIRDHATTLSHAFAIAPLGSVTLGDGESADVASAQMVSGAYYDGLGVRAAIGRTLSVVDDRPDADPAAVVSHRYWQRRFLGDPKIVGKSITVNRSPFTIVGVTPPSFHGTEISESIDVTLPLASAGRLSATGRPRPISTWWLLVMGRLKRDVAREQVFAEVRPIFEATVRESWAARPPDTRDPDRSGMPMLRVLPGAQGPNGPDPFGWQRLGLVFGVTAVLLLISCVNVAALLLVRGSIRSSEMTMRGALGATRSRLIRQLLTEGLLLAFLGAVAGLALAVWVKDVLPYLVEEDAVLETQLDVRALGFAAGLTTITALLFGIGYALRTSRTGVMRSVKGVTIRGGVQRALLARTLIAVQVAASLVLLVIGGLFARTLYNFTRVEIGFDPRNMLVFRIDPGPLTANPVQVFDLYERVVSVIGAVPSVRAVTMSAMPVVAHSQWTDTVRADSDSDGRDAHVQAVRWNFFETMAMPLLAGRALSAADTAGRPRVAVINAAMARQIFNEVYPLGRHFQFVNGPDRQVPIQVVGVVADAKYSRLEEAAPPTCFMPHDQLQPRSMTIEVRTLGDPAAVAPAIRDAVKREDPGLPLMNLQTQEEQIARTIRGQRMFALITAMSGLLGLMLACVGLYGIVSYDVKRRTSEIGVRMALGATRFDILSLVTGLTLRLVVLGCAIGLLVALGAARLVANQLFGVDPIDAPTMLAATAMMVIVASVASYVPARRATHVDPMVALRCD